MKENAKPSVYFSAYPLKAVGANASTEKTGSPYLRAILSAKPKPKSASRAQVFPMINPYKNPYGETSNPVSLRLAHGNRVPAKAEPAEKQWFNNYE
jgi:hypothetical protein